MDDKMQVCKKEYAKLDEKMNLQPYFVHIRQGAPTLRRKIRMCSQTFESDSENPDVSTVRNQMFTHERMHIWPPGCIFCREFLQDFAHECIFCRVRLQKMGLCSRGENGCC